MLNEQLMSILSRHGSVDIRNHLIDNIKKGGLFWNLQVISAEWFCHFHCHPRTQSSCTITIYCWSIWDIKPQVYIILSCLGITDSPSNMKSQYPSNLLHSGLCKDSSVFDGSKFLCQTGDWLVDENLILNDICRNMNKTIIS